MLKVIGINGSPRKGWNTHMVVEKALEGARDAGAITKLYHISDFKIQPCISCLSCKKTPESSGKCAIKDDLTPLLQEIKTADALVIGSPIYWSQISSYLHTALERMWFSNYRYTSEPSSLPKPIKTLMIYTMNVGPEMAKDFHYPTLMDEIKRINEYVLRGKSDRFCVYNTQQVKDYSKYAITVFDIPEKLRRRKEVFPKELEKAYQLGRELATKD
ncbi:flavodoxin family protein [Histomonas meleagridis]|uniref:flavodoxin family protein n=1 Tax=Histomonas meleagridis TaxID=135588 RepID=UPI003559F189|nr:flavodoxin family protein [Histomonas meleagridis]KAH0803572.1 flavodoxin family protein [Histomonas meleagridis]